MTKSQTSLGENIYQWQSNSVGYCDGLPEGWFLSGNSGVSAPTIEWHLPLRSRTLHTGITILPQYYLLSTERLYINHLMQPIGLPLLTL